MVAFGTMLAAFLSPFTNRRSDAYGGSLENRLRFPLAVVGAVREALGPELILGVRLVADELVDGGLTVEDAPELARRLVATGKVDYLSVIAGNNLVRSARVRHWPPTPAPHGLFRDLAAAVKRAVGDVPVCCVGRITDPRLAEEIVASGDADLVGMVRAHLADPELVAKARAGRPQAIRPCVGANVCINRLLANSELRCLANPTLGREAEWGDPPPRDAEGRGAVVVGRGPGGLEAARVLAQRGFSVVLFERARELGGQLRRWSQAPSVREYGKLIRWWRGQLEELGVEVRLGVNVSAREVAASSPDAVVVATGSSPLADAAATGSIRRLSILDAFDGPAATRAVVVDSLGRADAALAAESLAASCGEVVLVTSCFHVGEGEGITTLYPLLERLAALQIRLVERARVTHGEGDTLFLSGVFGETKPAIHDVDLLVTWNGGVAVHELADELRPAFPTLALVGDALAPRRCHDAVREAHEAARTLP
jgi:hypothetical protein